MRGERILKNVVKPVTPLGVRRWVRAGNAQDGDRGLGLADLPDWAGWIRQDRKLWSDARRRAEHGPTVLLATSMGGFAPATIIESLLGVCLRLRGARVRFLLCDKQLPACLQTHDLPPDPGVLARYELKEALCNTCYATGSEFYETHGLPVSRYGDYVSRSEQFEARKLSNAVSYEDIPSFRWHDLAVGEHAVAGSLRFYGRGHLDEADGAETTLRRFLEASLLTATAIRNLLALESVDRACLHHGIYVPQGLIAEALSSGDGADGDLERRVSQGLLPLQP